MITESKYCSDVMKNHFNKGLVITKKDNENLMNSAKCWICENDYVDGNVKVRDHCIVTGRYTDYVHSHFKLNHKNPVVFHNLKNYDSHLILQELSKFNFKLKVIINGLKKYMSFNINNKLGLIDSF